MMLFVLLLALLLTGCAAQTGVSPAVAFAYGQVSAYASIATCTDKADAETCKKVKAADRIIRTVILAPPSKEQTFDAEDIATLLGIAIGAAK